MNDCTEKSTDKRLNNLRPKWKPGESGNKKGFSKKKRELIDFKDYFSKHPEKWDQMIDVAIARAHRGDFQFWNALAERLKGKVPNKSELTGKDGKELIMNVQVISKETAEATAKIRKMFQDGN